METYLRGRKRCIFSRTTGVDTNQPEGAETVCGWTCLVLPCHVFFDEYHRVRRNRLGHDWESDRDDGRAHETGHWRDFTDFGQEFRHGAQWVRVVDGDATTWEVTRISITHSIGKLCDQPTGVADFQHHPLEVGSMQPSECCLESPTLLDIDNFDETALAHVYIVSTTLSCGGLSIARNRTGVEVFKSVPE